MKITDILQPQIANDSLLLGYYGGGNYGDELLLEVLQNLSHQANVRGIRIAYQHPEMYSIYHHEFGYRRVNMHSKFAIFRAVLQSKSIIVGGGGLWGLDFRFNELLMSILLFTSRRVFGKKVYLIGVGHYNSTPRLGRIGAWLAGKAANVIIARDVETQANFHRYNKQTHLDTDIAWYIQKVAKKNLVEYRADVAEIEKEVHVSEKTLLITLRRFQAKHRNNFTQEVEQFLMHNQDKSIIVALLEPQHIDSEQYDLIREWESQFKNVQALLTPRNPLALFLFFQKYRTQLALVAPQFHAIITARLNSVPFMPIVYDNKVGELLNQLGETDQIPIRTATRAKIQVFADKFYGGAA